MSLSHALSNALSGLTASSRMAEIVSANLANVLTDGYGRRSVDLSAQTIGGRGGGVTIDGISRRTDRAMIADRRTTESALSRQETLAKTLTRLETAVGVTGDDTALGGRIAALEQALVAASADPGSDIRLAAVVDRFGDVTATIRSSAKAISKLREEADQSIKTQVGTLNAALKQMESLNDDIVRATSRGQDASALLDHRQVVIDQIATIVPIRELDRQNGRIALATLAGTTLIDGAAAGIGFQPSSTITPDMSFGAGTLSGLTLNGQPVDLGNGIGKLAGGSLGAAFTLRDDTLVTAQAGLDAVARDLIERFQNSAVDPTLAIGDAGLLTDSGIAFDPLNAVGLAARIAVNTAIDPAQGGALYRLRDGVNAATAGPVGSAVQLDAWLDALDTPLVLATGGSAGSASDNASAFVSGIGATLLSNEADISFTTARFNRFREAELSLGVDSDEEMQLLLLIEQSYAANARVIQTVESLFQTLMEI